MRYPLVNPIELKEELITAFTGYDHRISATEGSYFDMENMTSDYYPVMSPRKRRMLDRTFTNFQGMTNKDDLVWVDNGSLYIAGIKKNGFTLSNEGMKTIVSMGAYLVFYPDKKWYNTNDNTHGNVDAEMEFIGTYWWGYALEDGTPITISNVVPEPPTDGMYIAKTENGKPCIYQYSDTTKTWNPLANVYTYIYCSSGNKFTGLKKGDGVKISFQASRLTAYEKKNIYINEEPNDCRSAIFTIVSVSSDESTIVIPVDSGRLTSTPGEEFLPIPVVYPDPPLHLNVVKRTTPDMKFVFECQNRLWGCSQDGHEIYASKLGDPNNWNVFQGISTDSWAATVGSDGVFTGAVNYNGYPVFFKEDSLIKVSISSVGGHSYKETKCRGVAAGSHKSLAVVNEILYYKARECVCAYDGSFPVEISDALGDVKYSNAVGGNYGNKYYLCMKDSNNTYSIFNYNTKNGIWIKEDNRQVVQFCLGRMSATSYFVEGQNLYEMDRDKPPISQEQVMENSVNWEVESNDIGYLYTSKAHRSRINAKKYIQKMILQVSLAIGSHISVYINYDSSNEWEFLYNFSGTTTSLCKLPIRPHRCNHFRYKIVGHGDAKIYSITKYYLEGSDV